MMDTRKRHTLRWTGAVVGCLTLIAFTLGGSPGDGKLPLAGVTDQALDHTPESPTPLGMLSGRKPSVGAVTVRLPTPRSEGEATGVADAGVRLVDERCVDDEDAVWTLEDAISAELEASIADEQREAERERW